jgi:hypothetical protein
MKGKEKEKKSFRKNNIKINFWGPMFANFGCSLHL